MQQEENNIIQLLSVMELSQTIYEAIQYLAAHSPSEQLIQDTLQAITSIQNLTGAENKVAILDKLIVSLQTGSIGEQEVSYAKEWFFQYISKK